MGIIWIYRQIVLSTRNRKLDFGRPGYQCRKPGDGNTGLRSSKRECGQCARRANQQNPVQPSLQEYFAFAVGQIISRTPAVLSRGGALAIVTNVGQDAVDGAASGAQRIAGRVDPRERSNGAQDE